MIAIKKIEIVEEFMQHRNKEFNYEKINMTITY
jgi:hypothetical protein